MAWNATKRRTLSYTNSSPRSGAECCGMTLCVCVCARAYVCVFAVVVRFGDVRGTAPAPHHTQPPSRRRREVANQSRDRDANAINLVSRGRRERKSSAICTTRILLVRVRFVCRLVVGL